MLKCSSCGSDAAYRYRVTGDYSLLFCVPCSPGFLRTPQYKGRVVNLATTPEVAVEEPVVPTPKKKSTKKAAAAKPIIEDSIIEEPAVEVEPIIEEEPVVEETTVDTSTEDAVVESDGTD